MLELPANGIGDEQNIESCRLLPMFADSADKGQNDENTYQSGSILGLNEKVSVTETTDELCTQYVAQ